MMFLYIILLCSLWRFQRVQDYRKRSPFAKDMVSVLTAGTTPERARNLRHTGISGPVTRNLRPPVFAAVLCLLWCLSGLGPEIPRRWSGVSGPTGVSGLRTRNLRPQVFSAVLRLCGAALVLVRSIPGGCPETTAWKGPTVSFWGGAIKSPLLPQELVAHWFLAHRSTMRSPSRR